MHIGDLVNVTRQEQQYEGVLLPSTSEKYFVLKLDGGYNIGIEKNDSTVNVIESSVFDPVTSAKIDDSAITFDDSLPTISLISTGGTIASTVDYRTGAVSAQFSADDILRAVPELAGRANYRSRVVANILSENMTPVVWQHLSQAIYEEIANGVDGVVVMHGTDTMQYSASAMAFMLNTPVPIVFTGSQRSADRPSSDNVMNAVCAVELAKCDIAEVLVCMHASTSDDVCAVHFGTRVRKNHTSRRAAFETIGELPLATIDYNTCQIEIHPSKSYVCRGDQQLSIASDLETSVALLKFTPGADPETLAVFNDKKGVVIEGTGLGHINEAWLSRIETLIDNGTIVVMASQCLEGRVCDRVYETGRDLLEVGVIEAVDTLPETALVKLMWALANSQDVEKAMQIPLAHECTARSVPWQ